jgi:hypothetical protein
LLAVRFSARPKLFVAAAVFGLVFLVQVDGGEGTFDVTATGVMARLNMLPASVT